MNPQINGPIEEEKKNQVNDSCYSGSNSRFLKQIFHVITHLKFISNVALRRRENRASAYLGRARKLC